jgi:hypothetical protein
MKAEIYVKIMDDQKTKILILEGSDKIEPSSITTLANGISSVAAKCGIQLNQKNV